MCVCVYVFSPTKIPFLDSFEVPKSKKTTVTFSFGQKQKKLSKLKTKNCFEKLGMCCRLP